MPFNFQYYGKLLPDLLPALKAKNKTTVFSRFKNEEGEEVTGFKVEATKRSRAVNKRKAAATADGGGGKNRKWFFPGFLG